MAIPTFNINAILSAISINGPVRSSSLDNDHAGIGSVNDTDWVGTGAGALIGIAKSIRNQTASIASTVAGVLVARLYGDFVSGNNWSVDVTLSSTANTISSFAVPTGARGFRLINWSARIRYNAAGGLPSGFTTTAAGANTGTGYLGQYNSLVSGASENRLFDKTAVPSFIYINSATAAATGTLEFF